MSNQKQKVVVTGIGAITALGKSAEELWHAVLQGTHGIHQVESIVMDGYMASIAGEVKQPLEELQAAQAFKTNDRAISFALRAAEEALQTAGLQQLPEDSGCVIGTCLGGFKSWERWIEQKQAGEQGEGEAGLWRQVRFNGIAETVGSYVGIHGPVVTISTACAAGGNAIGHAADLIRSGKASVVLAGGADALSIVAVSGFHSLQSLSSEPCKPYSGDRDGLSLGEGAGILVLESEQHAAARGARIYAEVLEFGLSADGYHPTAPHPKGEGAARAIAMALNKSGVQPDAVDYINGHGTGTPKNDSAETMAIKRALGEDTANRTKVSSTKSMIGHLLGAAGAVEGIVTVLALHHQYIPPTANYTKPDPECDLDYTPNAAVQQNLTYAISNNFAFGGNNCCVVFRAYEPSASSKQEVEADSTDTTAASLQRERVVITGIAQISATGTKISSLWDAIAVSNSNAANSLWTEALDANHNRTVVSKLTDYDSTQYISRKESRRMDTLGKLTVSVAMDALKDSELEVTEHNCNQVGVIFGTANGTMESLEQFYFPVLSEGAPAANPAHFPNTVFNQAAGQVAMYTGAKGVSSTVVDGHASFSSALCMAYQHIQNKDAEAIVAIAADVLTPYVISGYKDSGLLLPYEAEGAVAPPVDQHGFVLGEGAIAVVVESLSHALARNATIYAEVSGYGRTFEASQVNAADSCFRKGAVNQAGLNSTGQEEAGALTQSNRTAVAELAIRSGLERAMLQALQGDCSEGEVESEDIVPDAIFIAQPAIDAADPAEREAIEHVFADTPMLATCKHVIGEVQGAACGFQLLTALLSMQQGYLPQVHGNAVSLAEDVSLNHILVNGASLTGSYTSILLSKYE